MNTSKLADISEIVSSGAIVVTLIFLTIQVNQNTKATQAATRQAVFESDSQTLLHYMINEDFLTIATKKELNAEEERKLFWQSLHFFRGRENLWAQYNNGALDEKSWNRYYEAQKSALRYPKVMNWWLNYGRHSLDPGYVAFVETDISNIESRNDSFASRVSSIFANPTD